eukprot:TRINITY_DN4246_c0_g6_i1.p2 TRINITY_DN4246_c0_g6~~TRINITY_DN4246_c0_g6_i1.p2  ORF type:complete len:174 (+),score=38.63 TRINITY_DN4246_c0_g6_i1:709-1230(+)
MTSQLSSTLNTILNEQANLEMGASMIYMSLSHWFDSNSFPGSSSWCEQQSLEERDHSRQMYEFIIKRGGKTTLLPSLVELQSWGDHVQAWETINTLEQNTSKKILQIMDEATKENDHTTAAFLEKFILNQVEEEYEAKQILDKVKSMAKIAGLYYHIDKELGKKAKKSNKSTE